MPLGIGRWRHVGDPLELGTSVSLRDILPVYNLPNRCEMEQWLGVRMGQGQQPCDEGRDSGNWHGVSGAHP